MESSTIIYGPPGCGKSTAIIRRMEQALQRGVPQDRLGLVSFTRAAARELAERAGVRPGHHISTLHSYAFRLCRLIREQVVDRAKLREFSRVSKIETTGASIYDQESPGPGDAYLAMYGYMRSTGQTDTRLAFYMGERQGSLVEFQYFIKAYEQWKDAYGYRDFSDMLDDALQQPPPDLDILFLDEAQDFSPAQWRLIESWVPAIDEVVLALDDDQTLYKFTGADPDGGPRFEREYGSERVILDQSYRVPSAIHALAVDLIHHVENRVEKRYLPVDEGGVIRRYGSFNQVPAPNPQEDTLVLFRNHSLREEVEEWLQGAGVPYLTDNGRQGPLQAYMARAILTWRKLQNDMDKIGEPMLTPNDWRVLQRMALPVHVRKINGQDVGALARKPWDQVLKCPPPLLRYYKRLEKQYGTPIPETHVHLSTIHGSKGREADRVVVLNGMSPRTAEAYTHDPDPEIRAFYVAVTRSRAILDIVTGDSPLAVLR